MEYEGDLGSKFWLFLPSQSGGGVGWGVGVGGVGVGGGVGGCFLQSNLLIWVKVWFATSGL